MSEEPEYKTRVSGKVVVERPFGDLPRWQGFDRVEGTNVEGALQAAAVWGAWGKAIAETADLARRHIQGRYPASSWEPVTTSVNVSRGVIRVEITVEAKGVK